MTDKWNVLAPIVRGTSFVAVGKVHVLHEDRTRSWCGESADGVLLDSLLDGESVNCDGCKQGIIDKFYPMIEQRRNADTRSFIGREIALVRDVVDEDCCPKCRSKNVGPRFGQHGPEGTRLDHAHDQYISMDSEEYRVHYDTYICMKCRYWDFFSAFSNETVHAAMDCPVCKENTEHVELDADPFTGLISLMCKGCQTQSELGAVRDNTFKIIRYLV